jgi:hypothetical protein
MKYTFNTRFFYDEDDDAMLRRLAVLFDQPLFRKSLLRPRSVNVPPNEGLLSAELGMLGISKPEPESEVLWTTTLSGKTMTGRLMLCRNSAFKSRNTSYLDLKFSLGATWRGGPFSGPDQLIEAVAELLKVGPAGIGLIETSDEPQERKIARNIRYRTVDTLSVPESLEWLTLVHHELAQAAGLQLERAASIPGVRVGSLGDYQWVLLSEEPFSYENHDHLARADAAMKAVNLQAIYQRFPRPVCG